MKTAKELHETLDRVIDGIEAGSIRLPSAVEINNAVGKRIGLLKVELEYCKLKASKSGIVIEGLDSPKLPNGKPKK